MLKNIILIGFMGTGKTTFARHLSKALGYPHLDTDELIAEKTNQSINAIFAEDGEPAFRKIETNTLRHLQQTQLTHHIISTGGGITTTPENTPLLRSLGCVVWLTATAEEIFSRTARQHHRPLLNAENPKEAIHNLLSARIPSYQKAAHLEIETTGLDFSEVTTGIIESARYYYATQ